MSNEEIIRNWKSNASQDPATAPDGEAPANPAGNTELSDETLEKVAGGSSEWFLTLGCCPPMGPPMGGGGKEV
jgi:mersacidin/lichenicidin family type 2 lantibiotic